MTTTTAPSGTPETVLSLALQSLRNLLSVPADLSDDNLKKVARIIVRVSPDPHPSIAPLLRLIALLEYEEKVADAILGDEHAETRAEEKLTARLGDHSFIAFEKPLDENALQLLFGKLTPEQKKRFDAMRGAE